MQVALGYNRLKPTYDKIWGNQKERRHSSYTGSLEIIGRGGSQVMTTAVRADGSGWTIQEALLTECYRDRIVALAKEYVYGRAYRCDQSRTRW